MNALRKAVEYPPLARKAGIEGEVIIGILIGRDGKVIRTKILDSANEILNQAAIDAIRKVQFSPARQNGESVECWVTIPINFEIR
jgi:protein TonB